MNIPHKGTDTMEKRDGEVAYTMNNTGLDVETGVALGHNNHNNIAERGYPLVHFLCHSNDRIVRCKSAHEFFPIRYYDFDMDNNTDRRSDE